MSTQLPGNQIYCGFELINIYGFNSEILLQSLVTMFAAMFPAIKKKSRSLIKRKEIKQKKITRQSLSL